VRKTRCRTESVNHPATIAGDNRNQRLCARPRLMAEQQTVRLHRARNGILGASHSATRPVRWPGQDRMLIATGFEAEARDHSASYGEAQSKAQLWLSPGILLSLQ
jgi:hypothetical protein